MQRTPYHPHRAPYTHNLHPPTLYTQTHPTIHPPYPTPTPTTPTLLYTHTYLPPPRCILSHRFGDPGVIERSPATCFPMPEEVAVRVRANQSLDDLSKCASFFFVFFPAFRSSQVRFVSDLFGRSVQVRFGGSVLVLMRSDPPPPPPHPLPPQHPLAPLTPRPPPPPPPPPRALSQYHPRRAHLLRAVPRVET